MRGWGAEGADQGACMALRGGERLLRYACSLALRRGRAAARVRSGDPSRSGWCVATREVSSATALWGVRTQVERLRSMMHASTEVVFMMKFGEMSYAEAEDSVQLFGREVLPAVHEMTDAALAS